jgi:FkbM family methyltransferase
MKKIITFLYKIIPYKRQFCFLVKSVYKPNKKTYNKLYFEGEFTVHVKNKKKFKIKNYEYLYIEKCIFWTGIFGEWEKYSLKIWSELSKESNYIFDIGANTGVYSLLAKCINPSSNVFAFEPVERIYEKLNYNVKLNDYDIITSNDAVSNKNGESIFYDHDTIHTTTASLNKNNCGENNSNIIAKKINLTTLDTFIEKNKIPRVDLIKIDVETFEVEVLEGFQNKLNEFKPTILIEVLNENIANGITKLISNINYEFYNISETTGITKVDKISKSNSFNYLICTPEVSNKIGISNYLK